MLKKWKIAVDNKKVFGTLLTDLSNTFDCLSHDLLIAKVNAYEIFEEILFGVPQGSILGPLLFNIFLCDLFLIMNNIELASYADDNTSYAVGNNTEELIVKLQNASKTLFQCLVITK